MKLEDLELWIPRRLPLAQVPETVCPFPDVVQNAWLPAEPGEPPLCGAPTAAELAGCGVRAPVGVFLAKPRLAWGGGLEVGRRA